MKISVRNLEPTKVKLTVTVEPEELNPYLDAARKEIAKQVNVPGFRKGHVPGKIIDQRIGFAAVAGEAVNDAVPELYSKALDEKKIRPMAQPEFDVQDVPQSANDETKLKFTATVERRPDIELPEIDGLEIAISKPEVKDEDVDKRLETLRQRFGTLVGVDRPAAKGDFANIDLTAEIDGETVEAVVADCIHVMGENTQLARFATLEADAVCSYIHMGGKIGVLVSFATEGVDTTAAEFAQCGRDVAMQVAAVDPIATSREDVDPAVVEHEMGIYKAQAAESGKPEAIQEKMATGRLQKFYKEQCLVEQAFVKNPDQTVAEYVDSVAKQLGGSIKVTGFKRFALGEAAE